MKDEFILQQASMKKFQVYSCHSFYELTFLSFFSFYFLMEGVTIESKYQENNSLLWNIMVLFADLYIKGTF